MSKKRNSTKKVTKPVSEEKLEAKEPVKEVIEEKAAEAKEEIKTENEVKTEESVKEKEVKKKIKLSKNQWIIGSLSAVILVLLATICVLLVNQPKVAAEVKCRVFGNEVQYSLGTKWVNAGDVDEMKAQDITNDGTQEEDNPVKIIVRGQGSETEVEKVTYSGGYSRPSSGGSSSGGGSSGGGTSDGDGEDITAPEWTPDVE